jgi:hypothetical protein
MEIDQVAFVNVYSGQANKARSTGRKKNMLITEME